MLFFNIVPSHFNALVHSFLPALEDVKEAIHGKVLQRPLHSIDQGLVRLMVGPCNQTLQLGEEVEDWERALSPYNPL